MAAKVKAKNECLRQGLVLGKFMPIHLGHMALVDFALQQCDELIILLCFHKKEPIAGSLRTFWIEQIYSANPRINITAFEYDPNQLSDSSESSITDSFQWAEVIKTLFPDLKILFSSESYGKYLADFLKIQHLYFDQKRSLFHVSSSKIRNQPSKYWDFIAPVARPYFVKKIAIVGSESTGKSTLTENLARYYKTLFVAEAAREIIGHANECTYDDLKRIAAKHASSIIEKQNFANRFLFIDTEITITKSYSVFLFNRELETEEWMEKANCCDLYIFLEPDCPHVQDGTRLEEREKLRLDFFHREQFKKAEINYVPVAGNWNERFTLACKLIDESFLSP